MDFHGALADAKVYGDNLVGIAIDHHGHHLFFPRREGFDAFDDFLLFLEVGALLLVGALAVATVTSVLWRRSSSEARRAEAANLFFQLVSARYERASVIVTSNKPFGRWGEVFGDPVVAAAMIDRLVHHAEVV